MERLVDVLTELRTVVIELTSVLERLTVVSSIIEEELTRLLVISEVLLTSVDSEVRLVTTELTGVVNVKLTDVLSDSETVVDTRVCVV